MVVIDAVCELSKFRRFMIVSTCESFIPEDYLKDESVFPERSSDKGAMYVEAEDKVTLGQAGEIRFSRVRNVLGIIYNSKSGRTRLKWRHIKGNLGRMSGEASLNTVVNLLTSGALDESFAKKMRRSRGDEPQEA